MKRFCILGCALVVSAFAADPSVSTLLKTVEQRYNRAGSLQVIFTQSYTKVGRTRPAESGVLDLRKPGRMRWDYSQPKGKLVVCDGKTLWQYTPSENRVEKMPLKETDDVQAPIAFLLGKLHFDKEFKNIQGTPEGPDMRITAEPKSANLPYTAVEFLVTPAGEIRDVKVTQYDNAIMEYKFDQEKLDPKFDDKLFQFQPPKGADIVEANRY